MIKSHLSKDRTYIYNNYILGSTENIPGFKHPQIDIENVKQAFYWVVDTKDIPIKT